MLQKICYNQVKLLRFIASIFLFCIYMLDIVAKSYLPETLLNILIVLGLIFYSLSIILFVVVQFYSKNIMMDEMSSKNEARASQFTNLWLTTAIFVALLFAFFAGKRITLSFNALFCVMLAISAANDGCYLYFEKRIDKNANTDDEN